MTTLNLIDSLSSHGLYVWDNFLNKDEVQAIKECIPDTLQDARIGHLGSLQDNKNIRGDLTVWLDPEMGAPIAEYMAKMDAIRLELNREFYLGLQNFETHFSRYPSGTFYKKHTDNPRSQNRRKITSVLYLNEDWKEGDGGELVVYDKDDNIVLTLAPLAGRIILFKADDFPHEVLPTIQTRESITGWFLTQK